MAALQRWKSGTKVHIAYGTLPPGAVPREVANLARAIAADEQEYAVDAVQDDLAKPDFKPSEGLAAYRQWAETQWVDEDGNDHEFLQKLVDELREFATLLKRDPDAFVIEYRATATEAYWSQMLAAVENAYESATEQPATMAPG